VRFIVCRSVVALNPLHVNESADRCRVSAFEITRSHGSSVGSFVIKTRFAFLLVKMDLATDSGSEYNKGKKKIGFHFFLHV